MRFMARLLASLFVLGCSATIARAQAPEGVDPMSCDSTARHPVVTVPTGPVGVTGGNPQIDGKLDITDGEWSPSACLHDLIGIYGEDPGIAGFNPTRVWVRYDKDALYVGFVMELAESKPPKITVTGGHDKGHGDDAFELFL